MNTWPNLGAHFPNWFKCSYFMHKDWYNCATMYSKFRTTWSNVQGWLDKTLRLITHRYVHPSYLLTIANSVEHLWKRVLITAGHEKAIEICVVMCELALVKSVVRVQCIVLTRSNLFWYTTFAHRRGCARVLTNKHGHCEFMWKLRYIWNAFIA